MAQSDSSFLSGSLLHSLQLRELLEHPEVSSTLKDLNTVIETPFALEDLDGNLLFGQPIVTATEAQPITVQQNIIGLVKGDKKVKVLSRLLSSLLNKELLVFFDELTQMPNRRYFNHYLQQEWGRSQRETQPLSLLLCDLDYFKSYNDFYGHQRGDFCLQQVSLFLQSILKRPADLAFRYGGEEFAIILPNTSRKGAQVLAEQLVHGVEKQQLPHYLSSVSSYVTISLGLSVIIPNHELTSDNLFNQADMALYQAKETGRNRYCVSTNLSSKNFPFSKSQRSLAAKFCRN